MDINNMCIEFSHFQERERWFSEMEDQKFWLVQYMVRPNKLLFVCPLLGYVDLEC